MIGTQYRHNKRGSTYMVIAEIPKADIGYTQDGMELCNLHWKHHVFDSLLIQRSTDSDDSLWWIYENEQGMQFARPVSEFTPDRFTKIVHAHHPDRCPSNHWNDGSDICEDCGKALNE